VEDVVRAKRFELVDDDGGTRAVIDTGRNEHVGVSFFDRTGQERTTLGVMPEGVAFLSMSDEAGQEVVKATAGAGGSDTVVALRDKEGRTRVQLGASQAGEATFNLTDTDGNARVQIVVSPEGDPLIQLIGDADSGAVTIQDGSVTMQGGAASRGLVISDDADNLRVGLMLSNDSLGLVLNDAEGRLRATLQLSENGVPVLALLDSEGNRIQ
jgi:hypothetical protein